MTEIIILRNKVTFLKIEMSNLDILNYHNKVLIQLYEKLLCYKTLGSTNDDYLPIAKEKIPRHITLIPSSTTSSKDNKQLKVKDFKTILKVINIL